MIHLKKCYVCGRDEAELHHVVFRSQSKLMRNMKINFVFLCSEHHRGDMGPHRNRKVDLRYKKMVQAKLFNTLHKEFYTEEGLAKAIKISKNKVNQLTKTLTIEKEGYESKEVIRKLMGGRLY